MGAVEKGTSPRPVVLIGEAISGMKGSVPASDIFPEAGILSSDLGEGVQGAETALSWAREVWVSLNRGRGRLCRSDGIENIERNKEARFFEGVGRTSFGLDAISLFGCLEAG